MGLKQIQRDWRYLLQSYNEMKSSSFSRQATEELIWKAQVVCVLAHKVATA